MSNLYYVFFEFTYLNLDTRILRTNLNFTTEMYIRVGFRCPTKSKEGWLRNRRRVGSEFARHSSELILPPVSVPGRRPRARRS